MTKKSKRISAVDAALLEMAGDGLLSKELSNKITLRVLGDRTKPPSLAPEEIRAIREGAHMSQAVFAHVLNVTVGYVSQLERGAKRPTGAALALLTVIKRKGIQAVL